MFPLGYHPSRYSRENNLTSCNINIVENVCREIFDRNRYEKRGTDFSVKAFPSKIYLYVYFQHQ